MDAAERLHKLRQTVKRAEAPKIERIGWEGPVYLPPSPLVPKEQHAQCITCIHWLKHKERCLMLGKNVKVTGGMSCVEYAPGKPATTGEPVARFTPKEVGLVNRKVRCQNCIFFDSNTEARAHCDLFTQLNRAFPHVFNLNRYVDPYGCCDFQTAGKRNPAIFSPTGPLGEHGEKMAPTTKRD